MIPSPDASGRQTLLVEFAYRGHLFHGVQPQRGLSTVGGRLIERMEAVLGGPCRGVSFAARTDAGVSAEQNFMTTWFRDVRSIEPRLHLLLGEPPGQPKIINAKLVSRTCNARNAASSKTYRYRIAQRSARPDVVPTRRGDSGITIETRAIANAWSIAPRLDVERMRVAARRLSGRHDYSSFRAAGCGSRNPLCTLSAVEIRQSADLIEISVTGDRFLRKMVRILCGTLAEVGAGLLAPDQIPAIIEARQRSAAGLTAPASGLTLERVTLTPR